ncbi:MAG TPA: universal stress protein [Kofleriaceae bacterium]|nr:universal stress protein [Kofleriaceae bacterium]
MPWKTILVPHDFSSSANHAAAMARDVAKRFGARLILLHVAELPSGIGSETAIVPEPGGAPISMREYATSQASEHLNDLAARLEKDGVTVATTIAIGRPVDEILRVAAEEKADLIAMGTHGRTGLKHLVTGSVTERVVRTSPIPVLTVRVPD